MKKALKIGRSLIGLMAMVILGTSTSMTASAAGPGGPDTTIQVTDKQFWCGKTGTSQVLVSIANDPGDPQPVHGVEIHLSFDAAKLKVVDADGDPANGVQITAEGGLFPLAEQIVVQKVDNAAGTILFAVSQKDGAGVQDATNAAIATITWESAFVCPITTVPWEMCSMVNVTEDTLMSDADGYPITVDQTIPGKVCDPIAGLEGIVGTIKLQGRYDHSRTMVSTRIESPGCCNAFTDAEGRFKILPTKVGTYQVTAWKQGYLRARRTGVPYDTGQSIDMGTITLLGGDVVPDDAIDICDVTYIASRFGKTDVLADITGDGQVNILDLTMTAANFGQSGPTLW